MKRKQVLERLGFSVGRSKQKRVIILTDIAAEADDPYAIVHHLLSPSEDVKGIVAVHFAGQSAEHGEDAALRTGTRDRSFEAGRKILELMEIDDVPLLRGAAGPLRIFDQASKETNDPYASEFPESEGADFINRETLTEDDRPLYIACQGALTDLAIALQKCPRIASRMTAILIAGAPYPGGGFEPNLSEDIRAGQIIFDSDLPLWQIPMNVYSGSPVSLSEIVANVRPCGKIGAWLCQEMLDLNDAFGARSEREDWPHGEMWSIGDNPTVYVLLQSRLRRTWQTIRAPRIADDMTYVPNPEGREIRVYENIDQRLGIGDLFAKLKLCYGHHGA